MKKLIIAICLLLVGGISFFSCQNVTFSQVQQQVASWFTIKDTAAIIISRIIEKNPETVPLFEQCSADLKQLATKDVLTMDDVKADLQRRVGDSKIYCKTEVLIAIDNIFDKISSDPQFDVAKHKDDILNVAAGIDWAVNYHKGQAASPEVTVGK